MPTYTYRREDGSAFDIEQRITEEPLKVCPTTGQKVKRIINGSAGLVFKGSGFYLTDYGKTKGSPSDSNAAKPTEKGDAAASSKDSSSSKKESTTTSSESKTTKKD